MSTHLISNVYKHSIENLFPDFCSEQTLMLQTFNDCTFELHWKDYLKKRCDHYTARYTNFYLTQRRSEINICICLVGKCAFTPEKQFRFKISNHYQNSSDALLDEEKSKTHFLGSIEKIKDVYYIEFSKDTFPLNIDPKFLRICSEPQERDIIPQEASP